MDNNNPFDRFQPEIEYFSWCFEGLQIVVVSIKRTARQIFLASHRAAFLRGPNLRSEGSSHLEPGFRGFNLRGDIMPDATLYLTQQRFDRFVFWDLYGVEPEVVPLIRK